jgi:hypothetical protein
MPTQSANATDLLNKSRRYRLGCHNGETLARLVQGIATTPRSKVVMSDETLVSFQRNGMLASVASTAFSRRCMMADEVFIAIEKPTTVRHDGSRRDRQSRAATGRTV